MILSTSLFVIETMSFLHLHIFEEPYRSTMQLHHSPQDSCTSKQGCLDHMHIRDDFHRNDS